MHTHCTYTMIRIIIVPSRLPFTFSLLLSKIKEGPSPTRYISWQATPTEWYEVAAAIHDLQASIHLHLYLYLQIGLVWQSTSKFAAVAS